jgi:hypothetical protein
VPARNESSSRRGWGSRSISSSRCWTSGLGSTRSYSRNRVQSGSYSGRHGRRYSRIVTARSVTSTSRRIWSRRCSGTLVVDHGGCRWRGMLRMPARPVPESMTPSTLILPVAGEPTWSAGPRTRPGNRRPIGRGDPLELRPASARRATTGALGRRDLRAGERIPLAVRTTADREGPVPLCPRDATTDTGPDQATAPGGAAAVTRHRPAPGRIVDDQLPARSTRGWRMKRPRSILLTATTPFCRKYG